MRDDRRLRALLALLAAFALALGVAACGDDDDEGDGGGDTSATLIEENPDNNGIAITVGSKNFDRADHPRRDLRAGASRPPATTSARTSTSATRRSP